MKIQFNGHENVNLIIDRVYKGGPVSNLSAEPLHILFPKCGTSGGFRKVNCCDCYGKSSYVILYTSM